MFNTKDFVYIFLFCVNMSHACAYLGPPLRHTGSTRLPTPTKLGNRSYITPRISLCAETSPSTNQVPTTPPWMDATKKNNVGDILGTRWIEIRRIQNLKVLTTQRQIPTWTTPASLRLEFLDGTTTRKWSGCVLSMENARNGQYGGNYPLQSASRAFQTHKWIPCDTNVFITRDNSTFIVFQCKWLLHWCPCSCVEHWMYVATTDGWTAARCQLEYAMA